MSSFACIVCIFWWWLWSCLNFNVVLTSMSPGAVDLYTDSFDLLLKLAQSDLHIIRELLKGRKLLAEKSRQVPSQVDEYIADFIRGNEIDKKGLLLLETSEKWIQETVEKIAENPISTYKLLHRYAHELPILLESQLDPVFARVKKAVISSQLKWPNSTDLEFAAEGILQLQLTYDVNATQASQGKFPGRDLGARFELKHCYEIGDHAIYMEYHSQAVEWLELALEKSRAGGPDSNQIQQAEIQRMLKYAKKVTEEEKRHLFCWYEYKSHAKFTIGPLKMEFLAHEPDFVIVYDFIGDLAIKKIHETMSDESTYYRFEPEESQSLFYRRGTGTANWVWDGLGSSFDLLSISKNVEAAFGLRARRYAESEKLYVKSYTWASASRPHMDNEFVATAMHYLMDVEDGGYTAFPLIGLAVKPVKGAVVHWFNQRRDQSQNRLSTHLSCPVLYGRKQVATKWIKDDANIFTFNCARKKGQQFHVKVNGKQWKRRGKISK